MTSNKMATAGEYEEMRQPYKSTVISVMAPSIASVAMLASWQIWERLVAMNSLLDGAL